MMWPSESMIGWSMASRMRRTSALGSKVMGDRLGLWPIAVSGVHFGIMRGIISFGGYVPYRRLDRSAIATVMGKGGGRGTRSVASYDEDTTTMGVEAARLALRPIDADPRALWFATADPAYLEKTNATAIHAALRLDSSAGALDFGGAVRSGIGALRTALHAIGPTRWW